LLILLVINCFNYIKNKKKSPPDVSVGGVFNPSISVLSSVMLPKVQTAVKLTDPALSPTSIDMAPVATCLLVLWVVNN
jgi:hypothetical protein